MAVLQRGTLLCCRRVAMACYASCHPRLCSRCRVGPVTSHEPLSQSRVSDTPELVAAVEAVSHPVLHSPRLEDKVLPARRKAGEGTPPRAGGKPGQLSSTALPGRRAAVPGLGPGGCPGESSAPPALPGWAVPSRGWPPAAAAPYRRHRASAPGRVRTRARAPPQAGERHSRRCLAPCPLSARGAARPLPPCP